ncbi:hypothetical protein VNO78_31226 [Psophocarpus tetragonolobus]|uniref:Uncharacterized protein n=1 Tax=Psophocarpus tetragonolobus TaxID=3891 RepID=A0AAN9RY11_PSOTE
MILNTEIEFLSDAWKTELLIGSLAATFGILRICIPATHSYRGFVASRHFRIQTGEIDQCDEWDKLEIGPLGQDA